MFCNAENYNIENYTVENYVVENRKDSDKPALAGNIRLLLGLVMILAGFYIATLSNVQGHGLGFLLVFGSPFIIFKDDK